MTYVHEMKINFIFYIPLNYLNFNFSTLLNYSSYKSTSLPFPPSTTLHFLTNFLLSSTLLSSAWRREKKLFWKGSEMKLVEFRSERKTFSSKIYIHITFFQHKMCAPCRNLLTWWYISIFFAMISVTCKIIRVYFFYGSVKFAFVTKLFDFACLKSLKINGRRKIKK